eukprot:6167031-Pleurochrysis_carterae.AAC.1
MRPRDSFLDLLPRKESLLTPAPLCLRFISIHLPPPKEQRPPPSLSPDHVSSSPAAWRRTARKLQGRFARAHAVCVLSVPGPT